MDDNPFCALTMLPDDALSAVAEALEGHTLVRCSDESLRAALRALDSCAYMRCHEHSGFIARDARRGIDNELSMRDEEEAEREERCPRHSGGCGC